MLQRQHFVTGPQRVAVAAVGGVILCVCVVGGTQVD